MDNVFQNRTDTGVYGYEAPNSRILLMDMKQSPRIYETTSRIYPDTNSTICVHDPV